MAREGYKGYKGERFTFRLDDDLARRLAAAAGPGVTTAEIVRRALMCYLDAGDLLGRAARAKALSDALEPPATPALSDIPAAAAARRPPTTRKRVHTSRRKR